MKLLRKHSFTFQAVITLLLLGSLTLILYLTTPQDVGLVGAMGFFIILYIFLLSFFHLILDFLGVGKYHHTFFLSAVLAAIPTTLLALKSLNQLQPIDIVFVVALAIVGIFYWSRSSKIDKSK